MPKSKHRKKPKLQKPVKRKILVMHNTKEELRIGAANLMAEEIQILVNLIRKRKELEKDSKEYNKISFEIKARRNWYNRTAEHWNCQTI